MVGLLMAFHKSELHTHYLTSGPKKNRQRKKIWFNPPFSRNVKTNIGREFLKLVDKHFTEGSPLRQIFNRSSIKISYRCTPNLANIISGHNSKILKKSENSLA